ncbi:hypothetical protein OIU84_022704 [Salix udensis]|uniref:Exocyst subunit Exo70 family protein n=1 Tax=Salix udensis TaxID=889485 RepID=A0AAD6PFI9_9ROSI|nr:hypothetical protein OIU84_022704 [Salix udensis]
MEPPENYSTSTFAVPFEDAKKIILRWDSTASDEARERMIFDGDREEVDLYLQAVDEIQKSMSSTSISPPSSSHHHDQDNNSNKVNSAIQIAMARLEDEFRNILINHTSPVEVDSLLISDHAPAPASSLNRNTSSVRSSNEFDQEEVGGGGDHVDALDPIQRADSSNSSASYRSTSSIREIHLIPQEAVADLQSIAKRMISAGYLRECIQVYGSVRKSAVDASFRRLGIEKLSIGDIQRLEWEALETRIRRWIRAARVCVRILFASEKKLCEDIFYGIGTAIDDACFMETGKSKHYKDASLAHLFIMNNVHYIVQKIKGSPELREMIGDDYLRKLTGKFRQAATSYQRATWVSVLYCLRDEGLHVRGSFSSGVSKSALRERFKTFNAMFEEVHRTQATWFIPDSQLREELRISISEKLIPAYRSFLGRFRSHIESGKHPENYIKYSVEDLESAVLDFFEGYPVSQHLRRRSQ